jgi:hypothetical protein
MRQSHERNILILERWCVGKRVREVTTRDVKDENFGQKKLRTFESKIF